MKKYHEKILKNMTTTKDVFVYLMELEHGKYYVGSSNDIDKVQHLDVKSEWMSLHKPIQVLNFWRFPVTDSKGVRTILTLLYMREYGINNVRGGGYSEIILQEAALRNIAHYHKYMGSSDELSELKKAYDKVNNINSKIYNSSKILGLSYYDIVGKFDELAENPEFILFDMDSSMTRSKKRRVFGDDVDFVHTSDVFHRKKGSRRSSK